MIREQLENEKDTRCLAIRRSGIWALGILFFLTTSMESK